MKTGKLGLELIKHFEGLRLTPYLCPSNYVTWGYGSVVRDSSGNMLSGKDFLQAVLKTWAPKTKEDAEKALLEELEGFEKQVESLNLDLKQHEFDALVSFCYNLGFGRLLQSTLLKRIKSGGNIEEAFLMWNKAGKKELPGLTKRRKAESTLFLTGNLVL